MAVGGFAETEAPRRRLIGLRGAGCIPQDHVFVSGPVHLSAPRQPQPPPASPGPDPNGWPNTPPNATPSNAPGRKVDHLAPKTFTDAASLRRRLFWKRFKEGSPARGRPSALPLGLARVGRLCGA